LFQELQRQKADYDARRKRAEQLRLSVDEAEKEERRHAAQKQQEQQLTSTPEQNPNDDRLQQQNQLVFPGMQFLALCYFYTRYLE